MTDIEQRKASLEADINLLRGACGGTTGPTTGALMRVCSELEIYLAPSPQSPDNGVDDAIEDFCRTWLHCGMEEAKTLHAKWWAKLQAVKEDNAAQQPRQEWIPADVLSGLKGAMWVFEQHNLLHFGATHNTVILARQQLEIINKLINELPSPPKDK